jgi:endonuclease/exonuclease/phosphatase family metal-dependent hydrolase
MTTNVDQLKEPLPLWERSIWWSNIVLAITTIIAYISPSISTQFITWPAYFGLLTPVWYLVNIFYAVFWLFRKRKHFLLSVALILIGIVPMHKVFQFNISPAQLKESESIKVMSFNVRVFDLYNWTKNVDSKNNIIDFLENEQPDVICFQEYYHGDGAHFSAKNDILEKLQMKYMRAHFTSSTRHKTKKGVNYFGSAIFSRYPIVKDGVIEFRDEKSNHATFIDIVKNQDTIRIYNAHTGSLRLQNADYQLIGGDDNKKNKSQQKAARNLLARMDQAYIKRSNQVDLLLSEMSFCPYPKILCVDLNDVPVSHAYHLLSNSLTDAFIHTGQGLGSTYVGDNYFNRILPINRIDYIFHSSEFETGNFTTHQQKLSDHKPISCRLQLKQ